MNTTNTQKKTLIFLLFLMSALTQVGLVLYTPAFLQIATALQISHSQIEWSLSSYLLGFGICQLFYGPLSDYTGRRKMLLLGMLIFTIGSFTAIFINNYAELIITRFIQGIGVGSCIVLSRAILRDYFEGNEYIRVSSYLSSGFAFGLGVSPVIGGYLLGFFSWRAEFAFLFIVGVTSILLFYWLLPETNTHKKTTTNMNILYQDSLCNFANLMRNRSFICYLIGGVLAYGVVISFSTLGPVLFQKILGFSSHAYGWICFLIAVSYYLATIMNRACLNLYSPDGMIQIGLLFILIAGITMLIPYLLFHIENIYMILVPLLVATFGQALIWSNSVACALKKLGHIAGTASALFSSLQMILSAFLSAIVSSIPQHTQLPLAAILLILPVLSYLLFKIFVFNSISLKQ